ncbi:MAG: hypothetical protein LDL06_04140, partial [Candidatus Nitrosotenuis sp.]|nr:hypothetical protein [Candidatus Nitrosotenuis sp.]
MSNSRFPYSNYLIRIRKTNPINFSKFTVDKKQAKIQEAVRPEIDSSVKLDSDIIPKFKTLNRISFEDAEIYSGLIKDPTSKNGFRYIIIEPQMSKTDKTNFKVIKKLLISELDISLNHIKTKKEAARELKSKILHLIRKYNIEIPTRNLSKITYYAVRDFVYLGKIEPLMRDHMIEEISCDGTGIPLYVWHREFESVPTNIVYESEDDLNNFVQKMSYIGG